MDLTYQRTNTHTHTQKNQNQNTRNKQTNERRDKEEDLSSTLYKVRGADGLWEM